MRRVIGGYAAAVALLGAAAAEAKPISCGDPGLQWERRTPHQLQLDRAKLRNALDWATRHSSASTAVYRHGCLAAASRLDLVTSGQALDGWSMTKSVTSMVVGRAYTLGKLNIDKPIGRFYPEADAAHAALTPRHLLEMTAGLHRNWIRDLAPQPDRIADALALPFDHAPGAHWEYQQSTVTLLLNVVERAVGEDVQAFAQRELFGRVGIPAGSWTWDRDRAGNTEGWAHLHMRPRAWARLGHLMLRRGRWRGKTLLASAYFSRSLKAGSTNGAYGLLWWLNSGDSYVLPSVYGPDEGNGPLIPAGPPDLYLMAGMREQRVYVVPSRDLVIVRLGEPGSREPDTRASVFTGRGGQLDHEIARRVLRSVTDVAYDDPGPYAGSDLVLPPLDQGIVGDAADLEQVAAGIAGPANVPPAVP